MLRPQKGMAQSLVIGKDGLILNQPIRTLHRVEENYNLIRKNQRTDSSLENKGKKRIGIGEIEPQQLKRTEIVKLDKKQYKIKKNEAEKIRKLIQIQIKNQQVIPQQNQRSNTETTEEIDNAQNEYQQVFYQLNNPIYNFNGSNSIVSINNSNNNNQINKIQQINQEQYQKLFDQVPSNYLETKRVRSESVKIQPLEEDNYLNSFKFFQNFKYDNCPQNIKNQETIFHQTQSLQNSQLTQKPLRTRKPNYTINSLEEFNLIRRQKDFRVLLQ